MSTIEFSEDDLTLEALPCTADVVDLAQAIARKHGTTWEQVRMSNSAPRARVKHVAAARHEIFVALRDLGWSYPEIGRLVGGRDHSTVIKGERKVRAARALEVA